MIPLLILLLSTAFLQGYAEEKSVIRQIGYGLPHIKRENLEHIKFISAETDFDINALVYDKADYITYDHQFTDDFLHGILKEMEWVEERYGKDFIDSVIKRNSGPEV